MTGVVLGNLLPKYKVAGKLLICPMLTPVLLNASHPRRADPGNFCTLTLGCLNRFLSVDRFLDSRCHSRFSSAWSGCLCKAPAFSRTPRLRPRALFVTI